MFMSEPHLGPSEATGMMGDLGGAGKCPEKRLKVGNNNVFDAALALVMRTLMVTLRREEGRE